MSDRLEAIRAHWSDGTTRAGQSDVLWLVAEVERLREIMAASLRVDCTYECKAEVGAKEGER